MKEYYKEQITKLKRKVFINRIINLVLISTFAIIIAFGDNLNLETIISDRSFFSMMLLIQIYFTFKNWKGNKELKILERFLCEQGQTP